MGELAVMDRTGDTRTEWDPSKPAEVEAARAQFKLLRSKGYLAYVVDATGDKGRQLVEFEPDAKEIIFAPAMKGG